MNKHNGLTRRSFLQTCAATGATASVAPWLFGQAPAAPRNNQPNILLISTDQWHAEAFSHLGSRYVKTPHSDRIAERSVHFKCAYAADPVCAPSRTSWITGRMPVEHGVIGNQNRVIPDVIDMSQWFGRHGYETAHFGKWHTPGRDPKGSFDYNHGMHPAGQYGDASVAQMAAAYLLNRNSRKPFMAHVAFMNPHDICQVSCFHTAQNQLPVKSAHDLPELPTNFHAQEGEPNTLVRKVRNSPRRAQYKSWNETDWRVYIWMYYRYCELVDTAIGRVLDALDASGEANNTLVIYTSDHGEGLGHHGLFTKAFMYESAARVPFYMMYPDRMQPGTANESIPISGVDLMPTFCNVAGIPMPERMCGQDFIKQYQQGASTREALVTSASFGGHMVRDERYKLIRYDNDPVVQLFDLVNDPHEMNNLASDQPGKVAELWRHAEKFHATLKPANV